MTDRPAINTPRRHGVRPAFLQWWRGFAACCSSVRTNDRRYGLPMFLPVLLALVLAFGTSEARPTENGPFDPYIVVVEHARGEVTFSVELALTPEEQSKGLMDRDHLQEDRGMLFLWHTPRETSFWMENTYIPLDIIFIREDGTIHRIEEDTEPLSRRMIPSRGQVLGVLEINAGLSRRYGIAPGDRVRHPHFR